MLKNQFFPLTISAIRPLTLEAFEISFHLPEALKAQFSFQAGQYLTLKSPIEGQDLRRSYSLCCTPHEGLKIGVKLVNGGLFSNHLSTLKVGDTLEIMPPQGKFTRKAKAQNYVMVAAGSGITPILSLIKSILNEQQTAQITLIYGNKTTLSIMFREELESLKDIYLERLSVHHILSREGSDFDLQNGRITGKKLNTLLKNLTLDEAFICGPHEMVNEAREMLEKLNVNTIHFELFTPAAGKRGKPQVNATPAQNDIDLTLRFDGNSHRLKMNAQETVLEAATRNGLDLPFSCKGGMCCTCRAHLSEGSGEMLLNYSLEPWEMEAGFVLTCQLVPQSQSLTVDFDRV